MEFATGFCIEYELDAGDYIVDIRGDWDMFASANGAPELTAQSVLGKSIWEYVEGSDVRAIYQMLVEHVRATGKLKRIHFNCDDATTIRFFDLSITVADSGVVRFVSTLLNARERPAVFLLDRDAVNRGDTIVTVCSVCKFVDVDGVWVPVDEAMNRLDLMSNPVMPQVSHGLCPACFDLMRASME